jgi:ribonuclease HI
MNKQFFIFTDGSAIGNPGPAGWAAIVLHGTKRQEIAGSVPWSTVSEMELRAAVEALRLTPTGARIELRSDSELLIDGMRFLVFRWQRFGWRNSRGFELQHQELWRELLLLNATDNSLAMDQRAQRPSDPIPRRCACLPSGQSSHHSGTNCRLMLLADHNSSEGENHVNDC